MAKMFSFRRTLRISILLGGWICVFAFSSKAKTNDPPKSPPVAAKTGDGDGETGDDKALPGEKAFTECKKFSGSSRTVISLKQEADLSDLVGWFKTISCQPLLIPSTLTQKTNKVTILAPAPVSIREAYRVFYSALTGIGLTVQYADPVWKIVELNQAREGATQVIRPDQPLPSKEVMVTKLVTLRAARVDQVVQVFKQMKSRDGDITPFADTRTLVVTDLASNVHRMMELLSVLDVDISPTQRAWMIPVSPQRTAADIKQKLEVFFRSQPANPNVSTPGSTPLASPAFKALNNDSSSFFNSGHFGFIDVDDKTNSLIAVVSDEGLAFVRNFVHILEHQPNTEELTQQTYHLNNHNAEDLAPLLTTACNGGTSSINRSGGPGSTPGRPSTPTIPMGNVALSGTSLTPWCQGAMILGEKATNNLIIVSTAKDYFALLELIRKLDMPRRQVYIKTTMIEITTDHSNALGVSYHGGIPLLGGLVVGGLQSSGLSSLNPSSLLTTPGLVGGLIGPQFSASSIFGQTGGATTNSSIPPQFGILLQALRTMNDVNLEQAPSVLVADNEEALISIGRKIPFKTSAAVAPPGTGTTLLPTVSITRENIDLQVKLKVHVNDSGQVRIEFKSTIEDVDSTQFNSDLGPTTSNRKLDTVAIVQDRQPMFLGGLMRDKTVVSETKIPVLGDIPLLGYLFKTKNKYVQKGSFWMILEPYVINTPADLQRIFDQENQALQAFKDAQSIAQKPKRIIPREYEYKPGALDSLLIAISDIEKEQSEAEAALRARAPRSMPPPINLTTRSAP